jgi:2-polyprenyl-6-methoxyphenol hydroxylase-like FAD-dependent oxidoreductase
MLVGDAAHLITPWAGEGVNMALWDSLDLARALGGVPEAENAAAWQAALEPRVREYEEAMLARAQEKAEETAKNKDMILSENGGQAMADMFKMFEEMPAAHGHLEKDQEDGSDHLNQAKAISRNILVSRVTGQSATRNRASRKGRLCAQS